MTTITEVLEWTRAHKIKFIVYSFLIVYVISYVALSRHGMAIAKESCFSGFFFYLPVDTIRIVESPFLTTIHYVLAIFYYPLNAIDHYMLNGPDFVRHMPMMHLSSGS